MNTNEQVNRKRARLGFVEIVRREFSFLEEFGFSEIEALPTIVRYQGEPLGLNVYHGRQSYEIGVRIECEDEDFSIGQILRATDSGAWEKFRNPAATTREGLETGVEKLADLVRRYGGRALRNEPEFFADLRRSRSFWAEEMALDVLERQTRPRAAAAFLEGRYREAAELYERIAPRLSAAEQAKLAAARKRS